MFDRLIASGNHFADRPLAPSGTVALLVHAGGLRGRGAGDAATAASVPFRRPAHRSFVAAAI